MPIAPPSYPSTMDDYQRSIKQNTDETTQTAYRGLDGTGDEKTDLSDVPETQTKIRNLTDEQLGRIDQEKSAELLAKIQNHPMGQKMLQAAQERGSQGGELIKDILINATLLFPKEVAELIEPVL